MSFWETVRHVLILSSCLRSIYSCLECYVVPFRFEISSTQLISVLQWFFFLSQMLHLPSFAIKQKWVSLFDLFSVFYEYRLMFAVQRICRSIFGKYHLGLNGRLSSCFRFPMSSSAVIRFYFRWSLSCHCDILVVTSNWMQSRIWSIATVFSVLQFYLRKCATCYVTWKKGRGCREGREKEE